MPGDLPPDPKPLLDAAGDPVLTFAVPALAGFAGSFARAVWGPARTYGQNGLEIAAATLVVVVVGPAVCDWVGIAAANTRKCGAVYALLGFVAAAVGRVLFLLTDAAVKEVEKSPSGAARLLAAWLWRRWFPSVSPPAPEVPK